MLEFYYAYGESAFPFVTYPISAGLPQENDAPLELLSLDDLISKNSRREILYVRVRGDSMVDLGIQDGSIAAVDCELKPENGSIVLARLGATYTIKTWKEVEPFAKRQKFYLVPANKDYAARIIRHDDDFEILGVVTHCLNSFVE